MPTVTPPAATLAPAKWPRVANDPGAARSDEQESQHHKLARLLPRAGPVPRASAEMGRVVDAAPFPIFRARDGGDIDLVNEAWYATASVPRGRPVHFADLVIAADLGGFIAAWDYARATHEPFEHVARIFDAPAGGVRPFFVQATRRLDEDGRGAWYGAIWPHA